MARMKLEGKFDVVEYYRITENDSVHMGDHAGGKMEMLKARNSAREHLMACSEKKFMHEHLQELMEGSKSKQKDYNNVRSSKVNEKGLEQLLQIPWRVALKKYFKGGGISGLPMLENRVANAIEVVSDGYQKVRIRS